MKICEYTHLELECTHNAHPDSNGVALAAAAGIKAHRAMLQAP